MSDPPALPTDSVFDHPAFVRFWFARMMVTVAMQMLAVAVGWQVYALTDSALDLGLIGLAQFLPSVALLLLVGHVADRFDRRRIVRSCQVVEAAVVLALAAGSLQGWIGERTIFALIFVMGAARAFEAPTLQALLPAVVPERLLPRAVASSAMATQSAIIAGPALGGILYIAGPGVVYATCAALFVTANLLIGSIRLERKPPSREPPTLASLFAGIAFIRRNPAMLGAISLDMAAVLLGGATALLPIYARDILETGPWGLGLLRSASAIGALLTALYLSRRPLQRHVGRTMFRAVAAFGFGTIVFGISHFFALSVCALIVMGAADMISVVIRSTLVQLRTPDAMRGRVNAVNALFIGTSNQLGEFESGVTAALFGTVAAVVVGGLGTLGVMLIWRRVFPQLAQVDRLDAPLAS